MSYTPTQTQKDLDAVLARIYAISAALTPTLTCGDQMTSILIDGYLLLEPVEGTVLPVLDPRILRVVVDNPDTSSPEVFEFVRSLEDGEDSGETRVVGQALISVGQGFIELVMPSPLGDEVTALFSELTRLADLHPAS